MKGNASHYLRSWAIALSVVTTVAPSSVAATAPTQGMQNDQQPQRRPLATLEECLALPLSTSVLVQPTAACLIVVASQCPPGLNGCRTQVLDAYGEVLRALQPDVVKRMSAMNSARGLFSTVSPEDLQTYAEIFDLTPFGGPAREVTPSSAAPGDRASVAEQAPTEEVTVDTGTQERAEMPAQTPASGALSRSPLKACMDGATSTMAMVACYASESVALDRRLNSAYQKRLREFGEMDDTYPLQTDTGTTTRVDLLRTAQRAWLAFRTAECRLQGGIEGGSIDALNAARCDHDLLARRTLELEELAR